MSANWGDRLWDCGCLMLTTGLHASGCQQHSNSISSDVAPVAPADRTVPWARRKPGWGGGRAAAGHAARLFATLKK